LQKIVSQLAILGENISQEDLNLKFLRSLPFEWNTHVMVWRNKADLDTMSFDDLYSNFKMLNKSINKVNTAYGVSTTNTQVSTANTQQLAVLKRDISYKDSKISMLKSELEKLKQEKESNQLKIENFNNASKSLDKLIGLQIPDKSRKGVGFVCYNAVPPPHTGLFSPSKLDLSNSGLEEFQQPEFEGYGPQTSNSVSEDNSNEVKESPDALLLKELVSDDKLEKKIVFPTADFNYHQMERVVNAVKASACWVWKSTKLNSASITLKKHNYIDARGRSNGCSWHMTGNMSYLSDFKEFDEGYVTFGGGAKGGKITGKGTLKTDTEESIDAGHASKETGSSKDYILMPLWKDDKTVHEERGDIVERAATTAASLDAEQDSDGSPRCQDAILRDRPAPTRRMHPTMGGMTKMKDFIYSRGCRDLGETLMKIRSEKSKEKAKERGLKEKSKETATRPTRGVIMREASETTTRPTVPPQQKLDPKDKEEKQRIARVHESASTFNVEEWEDIQARVKADEDSELAEELKDKEADERSQEDLQQMMIIALGSTRRSPELEIILREGKKHLHAGREGVSIVKGNSYIDVGRKALGG
nr:ribonuclease H-like domain-containing protein [Tanacetum cinerariifolium]